MRPQPVKDLDVPYSANAGDARTMTVVLDFGGGRLTNSTATCCNSSKLKRVPDP